MSDNPTYQGLAIPGTIRFRNRADRSWTRLMLSQIQFLYQMPSVQRFTREDGKKLAD